MTPQQNADIALQEWQRTRGERRRLMRRAELLERAMVLNVQRPPRADVLKQESPTMRFIFKLYDKLNQLASDKSGTASIEYALLASLIGVATVAAMGGIATALNTTFGAVATALAPA